MRPSLSALGCAAVCSALAACASAPPPEPWCTHDHGRAPAVARPEPVAPPADLCDAFADGAHRTACGVVARDHRFAPAAAASCRALAAKSPAAAVDCLVAIADVTVGAPAQRACDAYDGPWRARCFELTAGRSLSDGQLSACGKHKALQRQLSCLEDATDYVFEPEQLHWVAAKTAREAPPRVPIPAELQARLLDLATLSPAERAETLAAERALKDRQQERLRTMFDRMQDTLIAHFAGAPLKKDRNAFLFNFAGGANAQLHILYCSEKEYVLFFGAPMPVNAYSGMYEMDVHDFTISGKMTTFHQGDHATRDFYPGSHAYLPVGLGKVYSTEGITYMLEYGRGDISTAYDFGIDAPADYVTRDEGNQDEQTERCKQIATKEFFDADSRAKAAAAARAEGREAIRQAIAQRPRPSIATGGAK